MTGYEYELQRLRSQRLQSEAETQRLRNFAKSTTGDLRKSLGVQLVKLGTRLQR